MHVHVDALGGCSSCGLAFLHTSMDLHGWAWPFIVAVAESNT